MYTFISDHTYSITPHELITNPEGFSFSLSVKSINPHELIANPDGFNFSLKVNVICVKFSPIIHHQKTFILLSICKLYI
jgi:hypothetical protein